ncbi:hypothetical protein OH76DRAFT_1408657 [Lentinus brumalis]|uniref:Uncharacterized protein n=1 Tax=Lentinus brumalis TaxID=2498619 RepID=A0A371CX42_9APHY|nr:hypothetical protein OH76DRAFT_1408657 [Polyporus brumalis]
MPKQQKKRSKSNVASKDARQALAKQAAKKMVKARQRITREQAADVTARINDEFAKVQMLDQQCTGTMLNTFSGTVPEGTVQELTDVMQAL